MLEFKRPSLIVFEGIDGSGKTTLSKMLSGWLEQNGLPVAWYCEPTDSVYGQKIRELAREKTRIPIEEELNYFIEDRKWNVSHNIRPSLQRGQVIILDRYYFSTACYQGARGLDMQAIIRTNREFAPEPDLTLIIDVEVGIALKRIEKNRKSRVRLFESAPFLEKVRSNYHRLSGDRIIRVDGNREPDAVFADIKQLVLKHLSPAT